MDGWCFAFMQSPGKSQAFSDRVNDSVIVSWTRLAPSKCEMLLQGWTGSKPNLVPVAHELDELDKFCFLGGHISPDGRTSDEVPSRIQEARLPFVNSRRMWHSQNIRQ